MEQQLHFPTDDQAQNDQPAGVRRRLGRGLNALLGGGAESEQTSTSNIAPEESASGPDANHIHVDLIERNPYQPRRDFDQAALEELADSIRQHGVLQPLLVRPFGGQYQLIAGERRWLAAKQAGEENVPCRVLELEDRKVCEVAIEENLKRKDLHVLEKAQAFKDYLERFNSTVEDLAKRLSMNRSTLSNYLRLLDLPDPVKKALAEDKITNGHARALLTLPSEEQIAFCRKIQTESLSVRRTEELAREFRQQEPDATIPFPKDAAAPEPPESTNHIRAIEDQLCAQLGAKVRIRQSGKEKGKIIIEFHSHDEFEHITRQLRRAA